MPLTAAADRARLRRAHAPLEPATNSRPLSKAAVSREIIFPLHDRGRRVAATATLCAFGGLLFAAGAFATPTVSNGPVTDLAGQWQGRSLCVAARPACTDETVLYRISFKPAKANAPTLEMNKIVAGKIEWMISLPCRFENTRQQLICPITGGKWQFRWDGKDLFGGLIDAKNGAVRFVSVHRSAAAVAH